MKRSITIIIFFSVLLASLFANDDEEKNLEKFYSRVIPLLEKNPEYKKLKIAYELSKREIPNEIEKWLPKLYFDLNSDLSSVKLDKRYYNFALKSQMILEQSLPLASKLQLFATQNNNIFFKPEKECSYDFNTGAKLNIPAWFIVPAVIDDYISTDKLLNRKKQKYLELSIKNQKDILMIKILSVLSNEKILKAKIDLFKKEIELSEKEKEKNDFLFAQGKLSSLELAEFDKKHQEKISKEFKLKTKYFNILSQLNSLGLNSYETHESLEEWLLFLEEGIKSLEINLNEQRNIVELENEIVWMEKIKSFENKLPQINMGCTFDFIGSEDSYNTFSSSIKNFWNNTPKLKWSVFMALRINLNPLDSEYKLNKNYKLAKKLHSINKQIFNEKVNNFQIEKKRALKSQVDLLKIKKETFESQEKQLLIADKLYKTGKITYYDFQKQKYLCEETKLDYFAQRYQCIISKLAMYQLKN